MANIQKMLNCIALLLLFQLIRWFHFVEHKALVDKVGTRQKDERFLKKFGANLKKIRMAKGVSQEKFAFELGTTQSQIARIELGSINTSISYVAQIAKTLKVPVVALFDF